MSCEQRRKNELFLFTVTVYFYASQVCHSVSLERRGDGFTAHQVQESNATRWERIQRDNDVQQGDWRLVETVTRGPNLRNSTQPGLRELRPKSAAFPGEPLTFVSVPKAGQTHGKFASSSLSRTSGDISRQPTSPAPDPEDGYHADFTGFDEAQGKVMGPSLDSSPHFSEWQAMRPVLQCDDNVMTFTASGEGFAHLLVDREGASPIPLLQLPSYCGYSMRTSWSDIEMMVPYDACYIIQENGSYVLPMLWWGSPLKLSCPMQMATPAPPFSPSVFCSPYGMAVQIDGQEEDILMLGVIMNGGWGPFVSEDCAYHVSSNPGELAFFVSYSAPCISSGDGLHLHFLFDDQEFILSCPVSLHFPDIPSPPPSPGDPQIPYIPDPITSLPTSPAPPPPPTQEQIAQLPLYPHYPYPGFQYPQLPQVYLPGPQPARPPAPTPGSPPGHQPEPEPKPQQQQQQQQQQSLYPTGPDKLPYSSGDHPKYPSPSYQPPVEVQAPPSPNLNPAHDTYSHQVSKLPVVLTEYPSAVYYPYEKFYYPTVTPAQTPAARKTTIAPPATPPPNPPISPHYPQYYVQIPYYPVPTAAPVTQGPAPLTTSPPSPPPTPPKQPVDSQYPLGPFYLPASYSSYYHYGQFHHPQPGLQMQPASTSHPTIAPPSSLGPPTTTTSTRTMVPKQPAGPSYPFSQFYPQRPIYFPPPTPPPPVKEKPHTIPQEPQKPEAPHAVCPPYTHTICGYYPYPYYPYYYPLYPPHYHPPYPPVPQYPPSQPQVTTKQPFTTTTTTTTTPPTTSSTASTPTRPTPQAPHLQCLTERMVVFLPFAHPDSIQVRDHMKTWLFLSSVSSLCGYMLQMAEHSGVILHSPVPACHSEPRTPTTISLPVRFWDLSMTQYRTLDLQCPYLSTPETPAPVTPSVSPTSPYTAKGKVSPPVPKPKVFCSSNLMTVELPSGPIADIIVKDIKGNRMNLQDAPKHCGYSARNGKDGKIHLSLQLHSRCHMSVQGKMYIITVIYLTINGRRESQFFCPVLIPGSGQECNLPSEQRLPCGPGSVTQPQCLSMGCCFSKQPPACYYPMDECTIDRHFVFSVPASLTEPPLSPALLVAAGNSTCRPQRVTSDYALFKIPMDGCGTRRVMVGKTMIYMVEVINKVQSISLNYGTITRDSPVRLLVECRYLPSTVLSVSYMVKTPNLGSAVQTQGVFGVQLRIAKDAEYNSYYPQYHQPLQMLLGKPLYLEVRLLSTPDPSLVLLVHYCVAYPRSGKAVWLLLYNGCPNPLDPAQHQAVLFDPQPPTPRGHTRRFTISTFQFLPDGQFTDPDEEIYFMCSTEICSPRDGPCVEGCFGQ